MKYHKTYVFVTSFVKFKVVEQPGRGFRNPKFETIEKLGFTNMKKRKKDSSKFYRALSWISKGRLKEIGDSGLRNMLCGSQQYARSMCPLPTNLASKSTITIHLFPIFDTLKRISLYIYFGS